MANTGTTSTRTGHKLPLLAAAGILALGLPSASLAVASLNETGDSAAAMPIFTPASVDPELALRVADRSGENGLRFTPADNSAGERTLTVAVRVDNDTARAISLRQSVEAVPAASQGISALTPARYNLGVARGYQSFAKPASLPHTVRAINVPDLSDFRLAPSAAPDKPSRFQPRIELEGNGKLGRAAGTIESSGGQSVDLGGAYSITRNLDVTAGVRISQERDRLAPLTDTAQDSQAVYVGTQFRF